MNKAVHVMRSATVEYCEMALDECEWSEEIEADFKKRGKKRNR